MPQLDISTFSSQIFWIIISFLSMYFIMSHFIVPRIAETLELRQRKIEDNLSQADLLRRQAEASLAKYEDMIKKATDKANQAFDAAEQELRLLAEQKQLELTQKLQKEIVKSEQDILTSKKEALGEVRKISESLALDIVKKIGIKSIKSDDIKKAIKDLEVN